MSTYFAGTNNLRFTLTSGLADFNTKMPRFDNQAIGTQYYQNRFVLPYSREHLVGKEICFQYRDSTSLDELTVYINGVASATKVNATDITPTGFTGVDVYQVKYTPATVGTYYFVLDSSGYVSDPIEAIATGTKDIVSLKYYNTVDDIGTIFLNDLLEVIHNPTAYFTGFFNKMKPKMDKEVFVSDRGERYTLRATPIEGYELTLIGIHETYIEYLNKIFSCDYLEVNGKQVETDGEIEASPIEETDCFDLKINLIEKNITYLKQ